jgi:hypothetical protein
MAAVSGLRFRTLPGRPSQRAERLLAVGIGLVLIHLMAIIGWQLGSVATILVAIALCQISASRTRRKWR